MSVCLERDPFLLGEAGFWRDALDGAIGSSVADKRRPESLISPWQAHNQGNVMTMRGDIQIGLFIAILAGVLALIFLAESPLSFS